MTSTVRVDIVFPDGRRIKGEPKVIPTKNDFITINTLNQLPVDYEVVESYIIITENKPGSYEYDGFEVYVVPTDE